MTSGSAKSFACSIAIIAMLIISYYYCFYDLTDLVGTGGDGVLLNFRTVDFLNIVLEDQEEAAAAAQQQQQEISSSSSSTNANQSKQSQEEGGATRSSTLNYVKNQDPTLETSNCRLLLESKRMGEVTQIAHRRDA
jgi:hypothetical protein